MGVEAGFVVGIDVGEANHADFANNENGRMGQQMVGLAGGGFDIDLIFDFIFENELVGHLEGDAKGLGGFHLGIGEERVVEVSAAAVSMVRKKGRARSLRIVFMVFNVVCSGFAGRGGDFGRSGLQGLAVRSLRRSNHFKA